MAEYLIGNVKGPKGDKGDTGTKGLSAYELAVKNGFSGTEAEWLESITTIVEGEHILNRSVIGVCGTLERGNSFPTYTRVKFIPEFGDIDSINETGEWICPRDGVYKLSAFMGILTANAVSVSFFRLNAPDKVGDMTSIIGAMTNISTIITPTNNIILFLHKGDNISFWYHVSPSPQTIEAFSSFSITLDTSINLNTQDLYEQWKDKDISRANISFDDWASLEMGQFTKDEVEKLKYFLANGVLHG